MARKYRNRLNPGDKFIAASEATSGDIRYLFVGIDFDGLCSGSESHFIIRNLDMGGERAVDADWFKDHDAVKCD